jgi:hypothetical protein
MAAHLSVQPPDTRGASPKGIELTATAHVERPHGHPDDVDLLHGGELQQWIGYPNDRRVHQSSEGLTPVGDHFHYFPLSV